MKYLKLTSILVLFMAVVVAINSCDLTEPQELKYKGSDLVEFKPITRTMTEVDTVVGTVAPKVQLIGEQREEFITIEVTVVDSLTTATPGRDFTMSQTTVTIPAGESAATFPFQVNFTHLIPDSAVIVYLQ